MMEEQHQEKPFNPYYRFGVKSVLSKVAPGQFYTEEELKQLKEIEYSLFTSESTMKEEIMNNNSSDDEGSTSERRAKPRKKKRKKEPNQHGNAIVPPPPSSPPELPIRVRNMIDVMNGTDIRYVMCKKLFATDLSKGHNRLSLPGGQIFLTKEEKDILDSRDKDDKPVGFDVVVLDPSFRRYIMVLKKWNMNSGILNLMQHWNLLWQENNWTTDNKLNHELDIWSFRVNGQLHFTLNNKDA
jgi:hypothetical protein